MRFAALRCAYCADFFASAAASWRNFAMVEVVVSLRRLFFGRRFLLVL
jgi:hypothetical protein